MCNAIDGRCELAGRYPGNPYHNNPTLYYQVHGELVHLYSTARKLKDTDPNYPLKISTLSKNATNKVIAICNAMQNTGTTNLVTTPEDK
jgi:hypothetical protein